jgi:membrane protein DedA with SNARE-associated domain
VTEYLLELVPTYGLWLLAVVTFLACLALPVPCSILMLTAGGFVASGDLVLWQVMGAALSGAVAGDQLGYRIGWVGGNGLLTRLSTNPKSGALIGRAVDQMNRRGALGIFLTRWLFAPVGPWANFAAGATAFNYIRFSLWAIAGEVVWVSLYVLLGYGFAGNIEAASEMAGSALGILAGVAAMLGFGYWLLIARRQDAA